MEGLEVARWTNVGKGSGGRTRLPAIAPVRPAREEKHPLIAAALALGDDQAVAIYANTAAHQIDWAVASYLEGKNKPLLHLETVLSDAARRLWNDDPNAEEADDGWYPRSEADRPRPLWSSLDDAQADEIAIRLGRTEWPVADALLERLVELELEQPRVVRRRRPLLTALRQLLWRVGNDPEQLSQ